MVRYAKIIVGLGMYLSCFPEQLAEGLPEGLRVMNSHAAIRRSATVGVSEKIVSRDGPCPHYRNGHFVLLSSDRYVNKKGQVVFRHGCFVKGQAKTVLSPEESACGSKP